MESRDQRNVVERSYKLTVAHQAEAWLVDKWLENAYAKQKYFRRKDYANVESRGQRAVRMAIWTVITKSLPEAMHHEFVPGDIRMVLAQIKTRGRPSAAAVSVATMKQIVRHHKTTAIGFVAWLHGLEALFAKMSFANTPLTDAIKLTHLFDLLQPDAQRGTGKDTNDAYVKTCKKCQRNELSYMASRRMLLAHAVDIRDDHQAKKALPKRYTKRTRQPLPVYPPQGNHRN